MTNYVITKIDSEITVTRDGERVTLVPRLRHLARPLYDVGARSESVTNLAHALLHDCVGRDKANLVAGDFAADYLANYAQPIQISSDQIAGYVNAKLEAQLRAQNAVWKEIK